MRDFNEIINNKQLKILGKNIEDDFIRITCTFTHPITRKEYYVLFTSSFGWEHLSISSRKIPDWETMCRVKEIFWKDDEACVEYHPKKEDYVNNCETCLHIWRPTDVELPLPPTIMVGIKDMTQETLNEVAECFFGSMNKDEIIELADRKGIKVSNNYKKQMKREGK